MNNSLTLKKANEIANVAKAAASVYSNNKELIDGVASAVGSTVRAMANKVKNGRGNSNNNTNTKPIIVNVSRNNRNRRGATRMNNAPVAIGSSSTSRRNNNNYRLSNVERIAEVKDGLIHSLQINPGMESAFPWLSNIARSYDRYRFHRLIFRYKPTCPTDTVGQVIMAWDYDSLDPVPTNEQDICQETYWIANSCWKPGTISIGLRNNRGALYTRSGMIGYADLKTYDIGQLIYKGPSPNAVGYIEVDYDITLLDRQPDFIANNIRTNSMVVMGTSTHVNIGNLGTSQNPWICNMDAFVLNVYNLPYDLVNVVTDYTKVYSSTDNFGLKIPAGIYKVLTTYDSTNVSSVKFMEPIYDPTEQSGTAVGNYVLKKNSPYNQELLSPGNGVLGLMILQRDTVISFCIDVATTTSWVNTKLNIFIEAA